VEGEVFFDREGRPFPVEYLCAPLTDEHGGIGGAVVSFRDVSERRRREQLEALEAAVHEASVNDRPLEEIVELVTRRLESLLPGVPFGPGAIDPRTGALRPGLEGRDPSPVEHEILTRASRILENVFERHHRHRAFVEMASLVAMAGRLARLGGWTVDLKGRSILWSDEVAEIHEVPAGHRPSWEEATAFYAPEDRARAVEVFANGIRDGQPFDAEFTIISARGNRRSVRVLGEPLFDEQGHVVAVRGAMQDITEQKRLEAEARVLAGRLKNVIDSITDAFYILDREWRFAYVNTEAERQLRRPAEELIGRVVWEAFPEVVNGPIETHYRHAMSTGETAHFELYHPPFGQWFEISAYPSTEGLAIHFRDVTERRALDARIREQAELIDRAQDAILVRDLEHRIRAWNKGAERLYGWTADEAVGQSVTALLYSDTTDYARATQTVIDEGEWSGELEQLTRDGRRVTVMARWALVKDPDGKPFSILAINTDVTEKKRLEQNLLRAQRLESIGTLAGGIAHDLNNVLAPILMVTSALASEEEDPERREDFATIERSAERGAQMVRQLLVFARGHGGQMSSLLLGDIASDVARMMRDTLPKNIGVRVEIAPDQWELHGDPTQMHQVVTNLCVNARDAMPLGGLLTIAVEPTVVDEVYAEMHPDAHPGAYMLLRVEDTGMGMTPEVLERMFEPFFTTKDVGKGTGLGLSTVHAIVRGHHGFINVYSEVGKGTRFRVYLPADPPEGARKQVEEAQVRLPRGHGELILVVDDEEMIRNVASRTLERNGYRTLTASNGAEAVAAFVTHRDEIALVLTDMAMPVMDGPATIVALRAMAPGLRIVGSSGLNANGSVVRAMDAGVRHFVPKPYTTEGLLRVLKRALADEG
jgi:PAS domain S-box-containing protein